MPDLQNFREQAINHSLFEAPNEAPDVAMEMLNHSPTNARYNEEMAKTQIMAESLIDGFPEPLRTKLGGFFNRLPIIYAGVDDHRATMAVEALGKSTLVGQQAIGKKKGGLFGMFSKEE